MAKKQENEYYQRERAKLEKRRKGLLEMRIGGEISKEEHKDLKDIIESRIARLTYSHDEPQSGAIDLDVAITCSTELMCDLAGKWKAMSLTQQQRLQKVVLPQGVTYLKTNGVFGTAIPSPIFRLNKEFRTNKSGLVAGVRRNWNQIIQDIRNIYEFVSES